MASINSKDNKAERRVRSFLHTSGFRFRLHGCVGTSILPSGVLPGKPDIVLLRYKTVILVNGCFWHQHEGCPKARRSVTNADFWDKKLNANIQRDAANIETLNKLGWRTIVIWGCELEKRLKKLPEEIKRVKNG